MELFHIVVFVNEMRQRTIEMNFFKQGRSVLLQTVRVGPCAPALSLC